MPLWKKWNPSKATANRAVWLGGWTGAGGGMSGAARERGLAAPLGRVLRKALSKKFCQLALLSQVADQ
jgi:hypothetical protein